MRALANVRTIVLRPQSNVNDVPEREAPPTIPLPPAPDADLAPARVRPTWPIFCFLAAFLLYVALIPHFLLYASPPSGDQPYYLIDVASLVQDGDLNVKNNYDNHDEQKFYSLAPHPPGFVGMSVPNPLPRQLADTVARPDTEQYSAHLPGLPVLLAPAWFVGSLFNLWWPATIVAMCVIGALVGVNVFLLAHEVTGKLWIALAVWAVVVFSSPVMTYSYLIFTELPTGLLLIYAFRRLALGWAENGPWRLLLVGACIGYIPWLAERCVLIAVPLGIYAAVQWWRGKYEVRSTKYEVPSRSGLLGTWYFVLRTLRARLRSATWLAVPILISAGLLLAFDLFRFGTLLPSATSHAKGQTEVFYWPWVSGDDLNHFVSNSFGLLFDIQWGVLTYAPVLVLAVVGLIAMFRVGHNAHRRLAWAMLAVSAPYMFVIMAYFGWNGVWCPPSRYQVTFVPLLAAPLAMSLYACRGWLYKMVFGLLALPGFIFMAIMMNNPILMWPFGDGRTFWGGVFDWLSRAPEAPVHVDLRHALPSFLTPDEARQPASTGAIIAAAFLIVFFCSLLIRRIPGTESKVARYSVLGTRYWALGWAGALVFLGLGWYAMNAPYLKPQTVLVEQHRWTLPHPLVEAHGMAYLGGKLYIASIGPRSSTGVLQPGVGELGEFDPATGTYKTIHPVSATGPLPYGYPGDIKVGPDGLLYLLNNGPGDQALYEMKPDGQVVRQVALDGKSPIAIGLGIGPDGKLYATDMGQIHQFGPNGGSQLASWGTPAGNFNNIAGVTVDPDNRVYGAETSEKRVHIFDSAGHLQRTVDLGCQPWQMVVAGDWLDISCEGGIRSLNRKSGDLQFGPAGQADQARGSFTGLAYGPDNTLYLLDSSTNTIIAYTVRH
jgi:hypothetical protein